MPNDPSAPQTSPSALRAGQSGDETAAWCATLRKGAAAQERIAAFTARKPAGAAVNAAPRGAVERKT